MTDSQMQCPVCGSPMSEVEAWVRRCDRCGFWSSSLRPGAGNDIDGIETLRQHNFRVLLDHLMLVAPPQGATLLEVGCGRGWFLDEAAKRGYRCVAIEPAPALAAQTAARGHVVHTGFFPDALPAGAKYSVIVFNDVFEHLPDPVAMISVCRDLLADDGVLVINLPSSAGVLFRIARLLVRFGAASPFERLWQKGLSSPHLTYFSPATLRTLAANAGFQPIRQFPLASMCVSGMWARLRSTQGVGASALMYLPLAGLALVTAYLPSDIHVGMFRKDPARTHGAG